jgi:hypothetical protein
MPTPNTNSCRAKDLGSYRPGGHEHYRIILASPGLGSAAARRDSSGPCSDSRVARSGPTSSSVWSSASTARWSCLRCDRCRHPGFFSKPRKAGINRDYLPFCVRVMPIALALHCAAGARRGYMLGARRAQCRTTHSEPPGTVMFAGIPCCAPVPRNTARSIAGQTTGTFGSLIRDTS